MFTQQLVTVLFVIGFLMATFVVSAPVDVGNVVGEVGSGVGDLASDVVGSGAEVNSVIDQLIELLEKQANNVEGSGVGV
ncbi:hypothetical protein M3Y95_00840300 [Aphelenchoides besseyi]|nr:hypothetical protein M3Y95_00840300 [Aphelenchoides besseyi]